MKVAIFSDIHANWQALEAVLDDCPEVDETLCLGDVVGYGGDPKHCVDEVIKRGWLTLVGNHDRACTDPEILEWFNDDAATVVRWTVDVLGDDRLSWLRGLPDSHVEHEVLLVHASPRDHIYEYVLDTAVAAANLDLINGGVCFHGHTHVPGIFGQADGQVTHEYRVDTFSLEGPALVNPGSIGQPRDGIALASYGVWDVDNEAFEFRRVPYDIKGAQKAIRKARLPERFALRTRNRTMKLASTLRWRSMGFAAAAGAGVGSFLFWAGYWFAFVRGNLQGPDFFSFYSAAKLYVQNGGSAVYDLVMQKQMQLLVTGQAPDRFVVLPYFHPPYYTLLIAPLAYLDFRQAYYAMAVFNLLLAGALVILLVRSSVSIHGRSAAVAAALILGFFPLFVTVLQGQSDLVVLVPLAAAYAAWARGRPGWAGIFSALALAKPQLLLLIPVLFVARRAWRALGGFAAVVAALGVVSVAGFGLAPVVGYLSSVGGWAIGGNLATGSEVVVYTDTAVYSLRNILESLPGGGTAALAILVLLLALVALSLSWRPDKPRLDFALAVAASLVLSPHQNVHDLALLVIPGFALADLSLAGELRWPGAATAVLVFAYTAVNLTPAISLWAAAIGAIVLAAYITLERLAVRPDPIPVGEFKPGGPRPRRVIVLPAYGAAKTLVEVVGDIPAGHADRILLVDDASSDATVSVATALRLDVIRHKKNLGYGGNQKTCYRQALEMGADVVVMLHPDGQYDPTIIPNLCRVIEDGEADIVLGSRWLGIDPAKAGMPWWKRLGNRFLTGVENKVLGLSLSEYHTGYRAYSRRFLEAIPFLENSNDFVFDTQVLIQAATFGFKIGEVPAIGKYHADASSISFQTSTVYGLKTLAALLRYVVHRAGFASAWLTPTSNATKSRLR